jgi:hypothetical protein
MLDVLKQQLMNDGILKNVDCIIKLKIPKHLLRDILKSS